MPIESPPSARKKTQTSSTKKVSANTTTTRNVTVQKTPAKSAAPKKANSKKAAPKKANSKKAAPKKANSKKAAPKKAAPKKAAPKKATSKKATSEKAAPKKANSKKPAAKKATSKKATSKKATSKKATSKKAAPKKATGKKSSAKKATATEARVVVTGGTRHDPPIFLLVHLPLELSPFERAERFEDPLELALGPHGAVTGAGTQLGDDNEPGSCTIEVEVSDVVRALPIVRRVLVEQGAPAGSAVARLSSQGAFEVLLELGTATSS